MYNAAVTETVNTMATQLTVQIRCALVALRIVAAEGSATHPTYSPGLSLL